MKEGAFSSCESDPLSILRLENNFRDYKNNNPSNFIGI